MTSGSKLALVIAVLLLACIEEDGSVAVLGVVVPAVAAKLFRVH